MAVRCGVWRVQTTMRGSEIATSHGTRHAFMMKTTMSTQNCEPDWLRDFISIVSTTFMSLPKRARMRPVGVVSKKLIGAREMARKACACTRAEALIESVTHESCWTSTKMSAPRESRA